MSQDVKQWIAEIRTLQHQIQVANKERDQAYASAENWRKLYQAEAQQRRTDARLMQEKLDQLGMELQTLQQQISSDRSVDGGGEQPALQLDQLEALSVEQLRESLQQAIADANGLRQALQAEKMDHKNTRQSLTTALADTMDLLTREKSDRPLPAASSDRPSEPSDAQPQPKSPWPELPHLH
ncbi:MAG: hypothetical protein IGR80_04975 [Synechococcales cyanobacterium K44_A2020_017]|jgi:hypothetical protein|nr:hypothetical protein [Synechococcales cyanobacterium K32_A2020_035]MBF2094093.1 hypothetical protein [Synechococcales cyanobacterium K44_A2020_017]